MAAHEDGGRSDRVKRGADTGSEDPHPHEKKCTLISNKKEHQFRDIVKQPIINCKKYFDLVSYVHRIAPPLYKDNRVLTRPEQAQGPNYF